MSLRIAFDLDGVLADMETELLRQGEIVFGKPMTNKLQARAQQVEAHAQTAEPSSAESNDTNMSGTASDTIPGTLPPLVRMNMTPRQERRLWRHVASIENFWESLNEIESGAIARLAEIAAARKWECIFLTKRPQTSGATAQVQTQRWLESKGFSLPSVYVVQGSRGRIANALDLDIVVDDRPENCLDVVVDSKAKAILVWREDQESLPAAARRLGVGVVHSVGECLDVLVDIQSELSSGETVLSRLKHLLGFKPSADA